jgi:hypothetical protein
MHQSCNHRTSRALFSLADKDGEAVQQFAKTLTENGVTVFWMQIDVRDRDDVEVWMGHLIIPLTVSAYEDKDMALTLEFETMKKRDIVTLSTIMPYSLSISRTACRRR